MKEFVYIVDDDEAVRDSLKWLLEGNGYSVKVFENAEQLLDTQAGQEHSLTGCLILDVRMPGITGIELHDELLTKKINIPVIFITGHGSVTLAVKSMKKGAIDFLEKPFSEEEICKLVDGALKKDRESNDKKENNLKAQCLLAKLTPRENQVLERITAGRLNKQIADDLNISIKTVEAHRANIMTKVEARTVAELIKIALTATEPAHSS
ncbi:MAG: DNA-binding response regulator [Proteobacteria bacterium]|jgi:FixJ family two-component response regulator|nr:DNA-binding response regulator [Pseudomonadota bacterium]